MSLTVINMYKLYSVLVNRVLVSCDIYIYIYCTRHVIINPPPIAKILVKNSGSIVFEGAQIVKKEPNTWKCMSKGRLLIPCEHYAPMTMIRLICLFVLT